MSSWFTTILFLPTCHRQMERFTTKHHRLWYNQYFQERAQQVEEESGGLLHGPIMDQPVRLAQWPHQLWRIPKSRCGRTWYVLVCHLQLYSRYWTLSVLVHEIGLSGSRDAISHVTISYPISHFLLVVPPLEPSLLRFPRYSRANVTHWLTWP